MLRLPYCIMLFLLLPAAMYAQVWPGEMDTVSYRLVGFSVPEIATTAFYQLQLAEGTITKPKDFKQKIILNKKDIKNNIMAKVPSWGSSYTWRISYLNKAGKNISQTQLYHFTTAYPDNIDTSKYRLRILHPPAHHKDLLVFLDYSKALYDMGGQAIWYLPYVKGITDHNIRIRDLKPTPFGTITFLTPTDVYEIDYDGNVLWRSPHDSLDAYAAELERYHHEFTRLSNGNYMVAGHQFTSSPMATGQLFADTDNSADISNKNDRAITGTIEEYNKYGNKLWEWKCNTYLAGDTSFFPKNAAASDIGPRMNSFYFDEKNSVIYISFKNTHHIVKIAYPSGEVLAKYSGLITQPAMFRDQHAVQLNNEGNIILFNNNHWLLNVKPDEHPSYILELKESDGLLKKNWEFSCHLDSLSKPSAAAGGNVLQLNDGCYITCVGTTGRNFIVSKDKKIIWDALMEKKDDILHKWQPYEEYRINMLEDNSQIEKLVFYPRNSKRATP